MSLIGKIYVRITLPIKEILLQTQILVQLISKLQNDSVEHIHVGFQFWKQRMKDNWTMFGDSPSHLLYSRIYQNKTRNYIFTMKNENREW